MQTPTAVRPAASAAHDTPIVCRNVWKVYGPNEQAIGAVIAGRLDRDAAMQQHKSVVAVSDVSFEVRRGEVFCIMGLSGSGKSTIVRHINRLVDPSAGEILIDGEDIARLSQPDLRKLRAERIGMVFQNMALMPHRSVRENVAFGLEVRRMARDERDDIAERMLAQVQLDGWGDRFPSELSGGMQQRVGIARALAIDPEILLMDEPFSALDPLIRRDLQDQFLALAQKMHKTTVFITHDLDEAMRLGDRIAIMRDGKIVQIDTPEQILLKPADDYVARFVEGISRLHVVTAEAVMKPFGAGTTEAQAAAWRRVPATETLDRLIELATEKDEPVAVTDSTGRLAGTITPQLLLAAIRLNR